MTDFTATFEQGYHHGVTGQPMAHDGEAYQRGHRDGVAANGVMVASGWRERAKARDCGVSGPDDVSGAVEPATGL